MAAERGGPGESSEVPEEEILVVAPVPVPMPMPVPVPTANYFAVFPLTQALRGKLVELQDLVVRTQGLPERSRVDVATFAHVTLLPPVRLPDSPDVDSCMLECVRRAVAGSRMQTFSVRLVALAAFGSRAAPTVIYVDPVLSTRNAVNVVRQLDVAMREHLVVGPRYAPTVRTGFGGGGGGRAGGDSEAWKPHITLLKTKYLSKDVKEANREVLAFSLAPYQAFFQCPPRDKTELTCAVDVVSLWCSSPRLGPSQYRVVGDVPLMGPTAS